VRPLPFRAMFSPRRSLVAVFALLVMAVAAPAAHAGYRDAIRDCADDGFLQGHYTKKELKQARAHLPADLHEYSDCDDVLARALAALANKNKHSGSGGEPPPTAGDPNLTTSNGAVAHSPQQLDELKKQQSKSSGLAPTLAVAGKPVTPGTGGLGQAGARVSPNHLPTPLLAALIAMALMGATAGLIGIRHQWPATRRAAQRIFRR
jgi:hypothetical protein